MSSKVRVCVCVHTGSGRGVLSDTHCCPRQQDYILQQYEYREMGWWRTLGQGAGLHPSHPHTHTQINTQNTRTEYVYVFTNTHKQFGSLWPRHTERLWLNSPAFYSMLLTLLRLTHTHTHTGLGTICSQTLNHRLWLRQTGLLLYIFSLYIQSTLGCIS